MTTRRRQTLRLGVVARDDGRPLEKLVGKHLRGCMSSDLDWNKDDGMLKHAARLRLGISR